MKLSFLVYIILFTLLSAGCHHNKQNTINIKMTTFAQTPHFIKSFLDTLYKGKFSIAEKEGQWNAGCVQLSAVPSRQFISAVLNDNSYEISFWQGGFVCVKQNLIIHYTDTTVNSHVFRDL